MLWGAFLESWVHHNLAWVHVVSLSVLLDVGWGSLVSLDLIAISILSD